MLLAVEIGLFVFGIVGLATGRMKFSSNKVVTGAPARLLGALAVSTLPLVFSIGFVIGFIEGFQNPNGDARDLIEKHRTKILILEAGVVFAICVVLFSIGFWIGEPPEESRSRRKRRRRDEDYDDDYEDDDDRPRSRSTRWDDDPEDDDRPRRHSRRDDDERDDDPEYDDRPRRRSRRDDD
jgi:hypothetical protein